MDRLQELKKQVFNENIMISGRRLQGWAKKVGMLAGAYENKIAELKGQLAKVDKLSGQDTRDYIDLSVELKVKDREIAELKEQVTKLDKELDFAFHTERFNATEYASSQTKNKELREQLTNLIKANTNLQGVIVDLKADSRECETRLIQCMNSLDKAGEVNSNANKIIGDQAEEHGKITTDLKAELQEANNERNELQKYRERVALKQLNKEKMHDIVALANLDLNSDSGQDIVKQVINLIYCFFGLQAQAKLKPLDYTFFKTILLSHIKVEDGVVVGIHQALRELKETFGTSRLTVEEVTECIETLYCEVPSEDFHMDYNVRLKLIQSIVDLQGGK